VAVEQSKARCTVAEDERLVAFGMQTSRLDEHHTVVDLMSRGVNKQPLRNAVGALSTGGAYGTKITECSWLIAPPNASNVTLEFSSFATKEHYDYVKVFAGLDSNGVMLASLTGTKLPSPITSLSGSMFVLLKLDTESSGLGNLMGFSATYRADNAPPGVGASEELSSHVCLPADARISVSSACRLCILATIADVCGEGCAQQQLHLVAELRGGLPSPSPCLPALGTRLRSEQAGRLEIALARGEPFGLTCNGASDLYTASTEMPHVGHQTHYVGLDTGYQFAPCDPKEHAQLWVITRSTDQANWHACRGEVWINMRTGEARSELESSGTILPMLVHSNLGECSAALHTVSLTSSGRLTVGIGAPAACLLLRFFGPQVAAIGVLTAPSVVEFAKGLGLIRSFSDIVVRSGQRVTILGNGVVLQLGDRQVRVMRGGELTLDSVFIAGSTDSSALVVEGKLVLRNSTVSNCSARLNAVSNDGLESRGGGVYVMGGGAVEVLDSRMVRNVAHEGMHSSEGGAIYATNSSSVRVTGSELVENAARDGSYRSSGGAIAAFGGSALTVEGSTLRENVAEGGASQCFGGAIHLAQESTGEITATALRGNVARRGEDMVWGGAIMVEASSSLTLGRSHLERNVVERGDRCFGGGITLTHGSSAMVADTAFEGNSARDAFSISAGGAIVVQVFSSIHVTKSSLLSNSVRNSKQSCGGAISLMYDSTGDMRGTEMLGNSAVSGMETESEHRADPNALPDSGTHSQGGALHLISNASVVLVNATLSRNTAEAADVAEGGACHLEDRSSLTVLDSRLCNNSALDGAKHSRGGAICTSRLVTVRLERVSLNNNSASSDHSGASAFGGALYAAGAPSRINITFSELRQNGVMSKGGPAAGGCLHIRQDVVVHMNDTEVSENRADGGTAEGAAIWSAAETLVVTNSSLEHNVASANGADGRAAGGAFFHLGVSAYFVDCQLIHNQVACSALAVRASGGGVHAGIGTNLLLHRCMLRHNSAGGLSYYQRDFDESASARELDSSATHIYSKGYLTLDESDITDHLGQAAFGNPSDSAWFWIVTDGGTVELQSSRFSTSAIYFFDPCHYAEDGGCDPDDGSCPAGSDYVDCGVPPPTEAGPYGRLLNIGSKLAQVVIRGCVVTNLTVHTTAVLVVPIGVVNSSIQPPLNGSLVPLVQPDDHGDCSTVVAGASLCDPRAICKPHPSGSVTCACIGEGIRYKDGTRPDGQQCEQSTTIGMLLQSHAILITVFKPSNSSPSSIRVHVAGESQVSLKYSASMVHRSAAAGDGLQPNSSRTWSHLDEAQLSLDGHHLLWSAQPPNSDSEIELDELKGHSATKRYDFQLGLDCRGMSACVADGDTVETLVEVASALGGGDSVRSEVHITTLVQSLISCDHSQAWIEYDLHSVPESTAFRVRLDVYDVDKLPVSHTEAAVEFRFGPQAENKFLMNESPLLSQRWNKGSNEYVGEASADLTANAGQYVLVVKALNGWKDGGPGPGPCILLHRSIDVRPNTFQRIVAGCLVGVMVLALGMLAYLLKRKQEQIKQALLSFLSFEGLLMLELCFEVWVRHFAPSAPSSNLV
jgi:hypothetical protein